MRGTNDNRPALREEADRRQALHKDHATSRPLSEDYEFVGLAGEAAFGEMFGLPPDLSSRPSGDKGVDFRVVVSLTVDVKTARKAGHLIHETGKRFADVYVLAEYDDATQRATLIGWEFGSTLSKAPRRDFGFGVVSHYIPRAALRPMEALLRRLKNDFHGAR